MRSITHKALVRLAALAIILLFLCLVSWFVMFRMPGETWSGPLPPATEREEALKEELRGYVEVLAGEIGERNTARYAALGKAADFIEGIFARAGFEVERQGFQVFGRTCENLVAELLGKEKPDEIVVVGGHYDSAVACPGANDNATGVAAVLALARSFAGRPSARTLRFAAFVNEEPPWFQTENMGSLVYARRCREREENVVAMLSLETIGYYSDEEKSQAYPAPLSLFYPSTGDFIGFVGNVGSRKLTRDVVERFRRHARFPSEGGALPGWLPGVGWSDHWAFWQAGYSGVMVTDTAPFRYRHYHEPTDTPDKIDFERMSRVVSGVGEVVRELAGALRN